MEEHNVEMSWHTIHRELLDFNTILFNILKEVSLKQLRELIEKKDNQLSRMRSLLHRPINLFADSGNAGETSRSTVCESGQRIPLTDFRVSGASGGIWFAAAGFWDVRCLPGRSIRKSDGSGTLDGSVRVPQSMKIYLPAQKEFPALLQLRDARSGAVIIFSLIRRFPRSAPYFSGICRGEPFQSWSETGRTRRFHRCCREQTGDTFCPSWQVTALCRRSTACIGSRCE